MNERKKERKKEGERGRTRSWRKWTKNDVCWIVCFLGVRLEGRISKIAESSLKVRSPLGLNKIPNDKEKQVP